jgi:hypothetical protein
MYLLNVILYLYTKVNTMELFREHSFSLQLVVTDSFEKSFPVDTVENRFNWFLELSMQLKLHSREDLSEIYDINNCLSYVRIK